MERHSIDPTWCLLEPDTEGEWVSWDDALRLRQALEDISSADETSTLAGAVAIAKAALED
jgi:hypothetical protein